MDENPSRPSLYLRAANVQQARIEHYERPNSRLSTALADARWAQRQQASALELSYEDLMITHSTVDEGVEA